MAQSLLRKLRENTNYLLQYSTMYIWLYLPFYSIWFMQWRASLSGFLVLETWSFSYSTFGHLKMFLPSLIAVFKTFLFSTTRPKSEKVTHYLRKTSTPVRIILSYSSPETLALSELCAQLSQVHTEIIAACNKTQVIHSFRPRLDASLKLFWCLQWSPRRNIYCVYSI